MIARNASTLTLQLFACNPLPLTLFVQHLGEGGSGVVQTAWALLGLLAGGCSDQRAMARAKDFLMRKQLPSGDWPQENITGIFSRSTGITYTAYRNLFPIWALARYAQRVKDDA
jgi:squalene cyclase